MALFSKLTGLFGPGPISPDSYQAARRKGVVDCVREDLEQPHAGRHERVGQAEAVRLGRASEPDGEGVTTQCNADNATKLGLTQESVQAVNTTGSSVDFPKLSSVMMDLAVLAAICDANRGDLHEAAVGPRLQFPGHQHRVHSLGHRIGNAGMGGQCVADAIDMIHALDKWYAQQFAYLVGRLDSITEGDRTLLDNSATVWFDELSDGNAHNLNNMPILQAGSCGGYFKTGWAVNVEGGKADMTPGHSEEDCATGNHGRPAPCDSLGTPPDVATQPINKYFCNLMNAIGVKAGRGRLPAEGRHAPVSKFGKYDDTTLFPTDTPAIIKNPGEYSDLRAT